MNFKRIKTHVYSLFVAHLNETEIFEDRALILQKLSQSSNMISVPSGESRYENNQILGK